jgi:high affinity Mn2+ porin
VDADRGPLSLAASVPARRLELRFGKMSTADLFDLNGVGSDSHLQFMNWTVDNNGAYACWCRRSECIWNSKAGFRRQ